MTLALFDNPNGFHHSLCDEMPARMIYQSPSSFGFDLIALQRKALAGDAPAFPVKHIATQGYQPVVSAQDERL